MVYGYINPAWYGLWIYKSSLVSGYINSGGMGFQTGMGI